MKQIIKLSLISVVIASFMACNPPADKIPALNSNMDSVSYAVGVWIATGPLEVPDKKEVNIELVSQALANVFAGNDSVLSKEEIQGILQKFSMEQQARSMEIEKEKEQEETVKEQAFFDENRKKEGIIETSSGLQYEILKKGEGKQATDSNMVKVHYTGKLLNGDVFDSSVERGEPAEFGLSRVIRAWQEGIPLMQEGDVFKFYVPFKLGYGPQGAGEKIKPFSTLTFEVELIEVLPTVEPKAMPQRPMGRAMPPR